MKTHVYIDGFSLYYGALKGTPYKWLDLEKLCRLLLPNFQVTHIHYFSAHIPPRAGDPSRHTRQEIYLRALRTLPTVTITLGTFVSHPAIMRLVTPPPAGPYFARVIKNEEKGSDVNLATQLLVDGFRARYEAAVVITNDSDLTAPLQAVRGELGLTMGLLDPERNRKRWSRRLVQNVDFLKPIRTGVLEAAQFPSVLQDVTGTLHKPPAWE
ncbi:MAG: NYN domain-containing protein [Litorilinea sp.]